MSTTNKSVVFLGLTFALSWGVMIGAWALGFHNNPVGAIFALTASMFGPAIAALICAFAFEKGRRVEALGLRFKPNWWWLLAWLIPLALAATSVVLTLLLTGQTFADPATQTIASVAAQVGEAKADELRDMPYLGALIVGGALVINPLFNTPILTFSEELGWRGYLHYLWRPSGFWRASLATGAIWGVWHAPAILLFGHNYPDNREIGAVIFVLFCVLLAPIMTLVRDRGGSVWAAGILHGTVNAVGGLTILALNNPSFPWGGIVGIGGYVALAFSVIAVALLRAGLAPRAAAA